MQHFCNVKKVIEINNYFTYRSGGKAKSVHVGDGQNSQQKGQIFIISLVFKNAKFTELKQTWFIIDVYKKTDGYGVIGRAWRNGVKETSVLTYPLGGANSCYSGAALPQQVAKKTTLWNKHTFSLAPLLVINGLAPWAKVQKVAQICPKTGTDSVCCSLWRDVQTTVLKCKMC